MSETVALAEVIDGLIDELDGERVWSLSGLPLVYLMRNPSTGLVKIGRTNDVHRRMGELSRASGVALELLSYIPAPGRWGDPERECRAIESRLHDRFAKERGIGEWFVYTDDIWAAFGVRED